MARDPLVSLEKENFVLFLVDITSRTLTLQFIVVANVNNDHISIS